MPARPSTPSVTTVSLQQRLLTVQAAATYLGISTWRVRGLIHREVLKPVRIPLGDGREERTPPPRRRRPRQPDREVEAMSDSDPRRNESDASRHTEVLSLTFLGTEKRLSLHPLRRSRGNDWNEVSQGLGGNSWGPPTDPRSRLGRLITRIIKEELEPLYGRPEKQALVSLMRETATWKGIARATLASLGMTKDATTRKAAIVRRRMGAAKELELSRIVGFHRPRQPQSAAELMALHDAGEGQEDNPATEDPLMEDEEGRRPGATSWSGFETTRRGALTSPSRTTSPPRATVPGVRANPPRRTDMDAATYEARVTEATGAFVRPLTAGGGQARGMARVGGADARG